jgi:nucleoside-diphosphate-sugar epimerase
LKNFVRETVFQSMEFSAYSIMLVLKNLWILEHFGFQIWGLRLFNLYIPSERELMQLTDFK